MLATSTPIPNVFTKPKVIDFQLNYRFHEVLGRGRTGYVVRGTRIVDNLQVAIKIIQKEMMVVDKFKFDRELGKSVPMEVFIVKRIRHQGIIQFVEYGEDDFNFYLVTEFHGSDIMFNSFDLQCGEKQVVPSSSPRSCDLFEYVDTCSLNEASILFIFKQICNAVYYLHENFIVHRDLKDENICIDSNLTTKLIDFGSAEKYTNEYQFKNFRGTLLYTPPELLVGEKRHRGPEVDMWCLGIVLYVLAYSGLPFNSLADIAEQRYASVMNTRSSKLNDLISLLLNPNPDTRITIKKLILHPMLQ